MTTHSFITAIAFTGTLFFSACSTAQKTTPAPASLREAFESDFLVGTALNTEQIEERIPDAAVLIPKQFNAVTPENIMKAEIIHPGWDTYNFTLADKIVAYGAKYKMHVTGHTLIWHSQLPGYVRSMNNADSLKQFFTNHINTVAGRYDGKVASWDVVNEALEEDGSMRKSIFLDKLGPDYVTEAFRLAQAATPNSELYYNDYNIEQPKKRAGAIELIKKIQAAGVRIDGVGIQGHWRSGKVPLKEIEESIIEYASLGIKVMFTELDLTVLPNPWDSDAADVNMTATYSALMNPYPNGLPDSEQLKLTNAYVQLFKLFLKHKDKISRVTFWGVSDGQSWLNGWPIPGRTNYPLLFDRNYKPKPAFDAVIALKK
ncbi:MAG TPA: endo-1,4-beta-xylanase [Ferruginibacter sp.]|nr:endo-1,4-beta-xylanase [Ferruginibacter sp.]HMP21110.1 endo-1,4-beta-xylanase [Ferruginibacter sp.]